MGSDVVTKTDVADIHLNFKLLRPVFRLLYVGKYFMKIDVVIKTDVADFTLILNYCGLFLGLLT